MMSTQRKFAPDNKQGEHPYVVETFGRGDSPLYMEIQYAGSLRDAQWKYGSTDNPHRTTKIRRARIEDMNA